jgi:glycosyltransferase involved in cell wall biosynthesis
MDSRSMPLVSIVTPVYNNEDHIAECIESILTQTYRNWDYTIVDNCSTDRSGDIARRYAAKDPRIKVHCNREFLRAVPNHNVALRQISLESKYCKIVFADDWIFPRCIEEMVAVAEGHPSVGIVGAYGLQEHDIVWTGLPYSGRVVSGREICRRTFLEGMYVFGTSTSVLYRSDLVRARNPFYNEDNFHADREACVVLLKACDFGFVHQILTFKRLGAESLTATLSMDLKTHYGCTLYTLLTHGPEFLSPVEFDACVSRLLAEYYNFLAVNLVRGRRDKKFWDYHKKKLNQTVGFSWSCMTRAVVGRICKALLNPYETIEKCRRRQAQAATITKVVADTGPRQSPLHANELQ